MAKRDDYDDDREPRRGGSKVATLTLVLAVLNIFASLGFGYLALLDYQKRQEWSFAVFMHDLVRQGLPSAQEETMLTAWGVTATKERLSPERIKAAFGSRGGSGSGEFIRVDDVVASRIKQEHLSNEVLSALFSGLGPTVKTIEEEAKRLKTQVLADISATADKSARRRTTWRNPARSAICCSPCATPVSRSKPWMPKSNKRASTSKLC